MEFCYMPHFPLCKTQKINSGLKGLHEHGNKTKKSFNAGIQICWNVLLNQLYQLPANNKPSLSGALGVQNGYEDLKYATKGKVYQF